MLFMEAAVTVAAGEYETPFCVEFSNDPNTQNPPCKKFETLQEAEVCFASKSGSFSCVWLAEIGEYETHFGNRRLDWMFFRWTEATDYGPVSQCERRWGYPADYLNQLHAYTPILEKWESKRRNAQPER